MTDKQIINFIVKEELNRETFNKIKNRLPKKIQKDNSKVLEQLKREINISESLFRQYIEKIKATQPMPHTELLNFIMNELVEQGLKWDGEREIFHILVPNEEWDKYKKCWYQWHTQHVEKITKDTIRQSIQEELKFSSYIWNLPEEKQREIIPQRVREFLQKKDRKPINSFIIESPIKPVEKPIIKEQELFLKYIEGEVNEVVEKVLEENRELFLKKQENQAFLLEALPIIYNKGFYTFLNDTLLPSLSRHHRDKIDIKIKEVNVLINIEESSYEEIFYLLSSILESSKEHRVYISTMIITSFRVNELKKRDLSKDHLERVLIDCMEYYYNIYKDKKTYHYYPAINLIHMIKTLDTLFEDNQESKKYNIEKIYKSTQPSIKKAKEADKESHYYATISDFEFRLLLNQSSEVREIEHILEELEATKFLADQSLYQLKLFVNTIKRFTKTPYPIVDRVEEVIEIFEDYIYWL